MQPRPPTPATIPSKLTVNFVLPYRYEIANNDKALTGLKRINLDGLRWRVFNAKGQVLGRLASQIIVVLHGKDKPTYTPHIENGDMCIVLNAKDISVT
ncbi:hypothetical protein GUJ93_ZPchr0012g20442 [Zizania palustris]|uniref:50S ribosomal protein L13 n=1 Tax=Zizania palustris TaxID=103762 RepID=A0A8J5WRK0_ZIZPA|nr:hypothetical protein GUJ93_ZPchr0012g20442 [Zizania palustris]